MAQAQSASLTTFATATVNGTLLTVNYTAPVQCASRQCSGFHLYDSSGQFNVWPQADGQVTSDATTLTVPLDSGIGPGDVVQLYYGQGDVVDLNGVPVGSLAGVPITNATPASQAAVKTASAMGGVTGTLLTVSYTAPVQCASNQCTGFHLYDLSGQFNVWPTASGQVTGDATTVNVPMDSAIGSDDVVQLYYGQGDVVDLNNVPVASMAGVPMTNATPASEAVFNTASVKGTLLTVSYTAPVQCASQQCTGFHLYDSSGQFNVWPTASGQVTSDPRTVTIPLDSGIGPGDVVQLYSGQGNVVDLNGVPVGSLAGVPMTNATPASEAVFNTATVNGTLLTVSYTAPVQCASQQCTGFHLYDSSGQFNVWPTASGQVTSDPRTVTIPLDSGIGPGDVVQLYSGQGDVVDLHGVPVASLAGVPIANATPASQAVFNTASVNGTLLTVSYTAPVQCASQQCTGFHLYDPSGQFNVWPQAAGQVTADATTVTVPMDSAIGSDDVVELYSGQGDVVDLNGVPVASLAGISVMNLTGSTVPQLTVGGVPSDIVIEGTQLAMSTFIVGGRAPFTYSWLKNGTVFSTNGSIVDEAQVGTNTYAVTVQDSLGQSSNTVQLTITALAAQGGASAGCETDCPPPTPQTPELDSLLLFGAGLLSIAGIRLRRYPGRRSRSALMGSFRPPPE